MKTLLVALWLVVIANFAVGQNESVIGSFTATEFNGKVLLSWSVKQGNTCNGIQILRSIDSVNFSPIGSINGVCGSNQEDTPYEFTDPAPVKNSINYYRLNLGGIGFSKIVYAEVIDIPNNTFLLRPNPIESQSELHFNNDASDEVVITIYNQGGVPVKSLLTQEEKVMIDRSDYTSGVYFFTIFNGTRNVSVSGKFVIP